MTFAKSICTVALVATTTLCGGAFAQTQLPAPSPLLDGGSMMGDAPIDDLALIDVNELLKTRGGPTQLTIQAQQVLLSELLPQISEQTGLPFRAQNDVILNRVRLSPDIKGASFWRAMRELLTPIEGHLQRAFSPDGLFITVGAPPLPGRTSEVGPLFLAAERIENQSSLLLDPKTAANQARESKLTLTLNVGFDPRLLAEPGMTHCRILEARDDTGAPLSLATANEAPDVGGQASNWNTTQIRLPLSGLAPNARKLSVVRGIISVPVWSGSDTWEVSDLQNLPQEKIIGERTFRLEKVGKEKDNDRSEAVITIPARPKAQGGASIGDVTTAMSLFDQAGRELFSNGQGGGRDSEGTRTQRFYFTGEPKTLLLRVSHSLRRIEVPWEMRDLPLP